MALLNWLQMGELDIVRRVVRQGAHELRLTGPEHALLYLLVANAGRVISRAEIEDALWGRELTKSSNSVDPYVRSRRAKLLHDERPPRFIATVEARASPGFCPRRRWEWLVLTLRHAYASDPAPTSCNSGGIGEWHVRGCQAAESQNLGEELTEIERFGETAVGLDLAGPAAGVRGRRHHQDLSLIHI